MTMQDESRDRWLRIASLFDEAVKLPPEERPAFLEGSLRVVGPAHPYSANVYYSLACLDVQRGRSKDALGWLRKAVDAGYSDVTFMEKDPNLAPLRSDSGFQRLVADAHANHAKVERDSPP